MFVATSESMLLHGSRFNKVQAVTVLTEIEHRSLIRAYVYMWTLYFLCLCVSWLLRFIFRYNNNMAFSHLGIMR